MTDSLPSVLKAEIERFEALFLPDGSEADHPDVVERLQTAKSLLCTFGVELRSCCTASRGPRRTA